MYDVSGLCAYIQACRGQRLMLVSSPVALHFSFFLNFETGSLTESGAPQLPRLAAQLTPGTLIAPILVAGITGTC